MSSQPLPPIEPVDRNREAAILKLNNLHAQELSWLEPERLSHLLDNAAHALSIGDAEAFLISFDQNADYDSPNFLWFRENYPRFIYVDRVVVSEAVRGRGHARRLYEHLFDLALKAGHDTIVCEVNSDPPNPASDAFHDRLGFREVGEATIHGGSKTVRYFARKLDKAGATPSLTPSKDISRLIEIMAALRARVGGCPWDVEQTFSTIAPYTIEEAYEVADAIQRGDFDDLREELGDLLLQVVYHARMAEEQGEFAFPDVVEAITTKMIRRHPHVFGDDHARSAGMAKGMWEKIKSEEKAEKRAARIARGQDPEDNGKGYLDSVPLPLPALTRALKLQEKAARVGFDWGAAAPILDKIEEEIGELRQALAAGKSDAIRDEFGDTLFALVNLGRHLGVDSEASLAGTNDKFRNRFHYIERSLDEKGKLLEDATLEEMEELWQQAKGKV